MDDGDHDNPSCSRPPQQGARAERREWGTVWGIAFFSPAEQAPGAAGAAAPSAGARASVAAPSSTRPEGGGEPRPAAPSSATASASASAGGAGAGAGDAPPPPTTPPPKVAAEDDMWESSKPVERRSQALTDELHDCLGLFWSWVTCGGPGARVRQLYVNGRLSRCADEWARLRTCGAIKFSSPAGGGEVDVVVNPGPHPVWRIRSRKEARAFWADNYAHLGAGAVSGSGQGAAAGGGSGGGEGGGGDAAAAADGGPSADTEEAPAAKAG